MIVPGRDPCKVLVSKAEIKVSAIYLTSALRPHAYYIVERHTLSNPRSVICTTSLVPDNHVVDSNVYHKG